MYFLRILDYPKMLNLLIMKTVLLCLTLCFCTFAVAKNKSRNSPVSTKSAPLERVVNSSFSAFSGDDLTTPNLNKSQSTNTSDFRAILYGAQSYALLDEFSDHSENSYIKNENTASGASNIIKDNSYQETSVSSDSQHIFRQGMFYGFTLMLILGNLVSFFLFEEKTFLYYAVALASTGLLLFYSDGLFTVLGFEDIFANQAIFLLFSTAFTALFVSKYLVLEEYLPKLKWFTAAALVGASVILLFAVATENTILLNVTNVILFTVLCIYFLSGVLVFSKKNYAKFYVIASAIPLLFSFDYFLLRPMRIDFLATQGIHIKAAAIAEMLIITYAILYRMQAIKEENALRQAELRIFLKRQEVLSTRQKTQKLVEDVYLENLIMHYDLDGLEIKLLQYISEGKENAKIARKLKSSEDEIEDMIKDLYDKLEISEQIQQDFRMVESQPDYIYN